MTNQRIKPTFMTLAAKEGALYFNKHLCKSCELFFFGANCKSAFVNLIGLV